MADWKQYCKGYLRIRLLSREPERFINLCGNHGILLWNLQNSNNYYETEISVRNFYRLRPLCRKTHTRIQILEKKGLPFFFYRNKKRKAFLTGIVVCLLLLFVLSRHIWNIHVEGNLTYTTQSILAFLEEEDIRHGILKKKIDCTQIAGQLRRNFPDIIWVSAKIQGTRLILQIQENTDRYTVKENADSTSAIDLVAGKTGTIVSIVTRSGTPLKKEGDTCEAGEILVQGRVDIMGDNGEVAGYQYVHSDADIYLETAYQYYQEFPLTSQKRTYTGEKKKNYFLQILSVRAATGTRHAPYAAFDSVTHTERVHLTENFILPITYGSVTNLEYEKIPVTMSGQEARKKAETELSYFLEKLKEKGVQICSNHVKINVTDSCCVAKGRICVIEKTGKPQDTEVVEERTQETE
ncbi:MAG: sporulation protein YqfD [Lachnospiraceae bacterium]|jgi:similar to stage IV sporulation protein